MTDTEDPEETVDPEDADETDSAPPSPSEVTLLLGAWSQGDSDALNRLMPQVYNELRKVAQRNMNLEENSTLQATALVNEAYMRFVDMDVVFNDRVHFFAVAAGLMRRILVDRARRRRAKKRGGGERAVVLEDVSAGTRPADDLLSLDQALSSLAKKDPRKARVLELRLFGGLTIDETCKAMDLSHASVERDLKTAKAWVMQRLKSEPSKG